MSLIPFVGKTENIDVLTVAVSSSVVAFLLVSIITFILGIFCGHYCGRIRKSPKEKRHITTGQSHPDKAPVYEGPLHVPLKAVKSQKQGDLDLKENVAYHPASTSTSIEYYQ